MAILNPRIDVDVRADNHATDYLEIDAGFRHIFEGDASFKAS